MFHLITVLYNSTLPKAFKRAISIDNVHLISGFIIRDKFSIASALPENAHYQFITD